MKWKKEFVWNNKNVAFMNDQNDLSYFAKQFFIHFVIW
jgi:hypothetical protein